jgi:trans-aconitate methyltransferase
VTGLEAKALQQIDTTVAHPARRYNYWLGGKDHFAADRESGDAIEAVFPSIRLAAQENRRFMRRVVIYLTREAGIRQFLDIGTGIPAPDNTHEVAQAIDPTSRIVYVDNDPIVLSHARALLTPTPEGATAYLEADLRAPETILGHADLARTLDMSKPVGLLLIAVLQFIGDDEDPYGIVTRLLHALPAGSYLAISHPSFDLMPETTATRLAAATAGETFQARTRVDVARFVAGLDLIAPGLRSITDWRPDDEPRPSATAEETAMYGVVARLS